MTQSNDNAATAPEDQAAVDTLHQIGREFLTLIAPPKVSLIATVGPDRYGRTTVEARAEADDRQLHRDLLNLDKAPHREKFAKAVQKAAPDLCDPKDLSRRLMDLEPEDTEVDSAEKLSPLSVEDVAGSDVVRPGAFATKTLAGLLVPRLLKMPGPSGQDVLFVAFEFLLCHRDGTRARVRFTRTLTAQDGGQLYVSGNAPYVSPRTIQTRWTRAAQDRWLSGETPRIEDVRDQLASVIASRVWLPADVEDALSMLLACYVILTYVAEALDVVAYLHVTGPKDSGKTQGVLMLLADLAFAPLAASDVSAPVIFRWLDTCGGTLLLDEAEGLGSSPERSQDVTGILNAGHCKGFPARRCEREGDRIVVREYDCFGPKVLAGIAHLPHVLASRCIPIPMLRRPKGMDMPPSDVDVAKLRDDLHALTLTYAIELRDLLRAPGDFGLSNRAADLWGPLLKIAAWLDPDGSLELARILSDYAKTATATAEEDYGVPETDEALLRALYQRVADDSHGDASAGDLLGDVQRTHPRLFDSWTPRRVSAALGRYRIRSHKRRCGKQYKRVYDGVTREKLAQIMDTYGIDVPDGATA